MKRLIAFLTSRRIDAPVQRYPETSATAGLLALAMSLGTPIALEEVWQWPTLWAWLIGIPAGYGLWFLCAATSITLRLGAPLLWLWLRVLWAEKRAARRSSE